MYVLRDGRIYSGGLGLWSSLQVGIDDLRERTVFCTGDAMIYGVKVDQNSIQSLTADIFNETGLDGGRDAFAKAFTELARQG